MAMWGQDDFWKGVQSKNGANALIGLGTGLLQGNTFAKGLAAGGQGFMQGAQLDDQYAADAEKKAKEAQGLNQTLEYMRSKGYDDLIAGVESGGMDMGAAWTEALRRGQPATATADWAKLNDGTLFNQRTGETMPLEGMEGGYIDPKASFDNEKDLYAQYSSADPVKTYEVVKGSYERLRQAAEIGNTNTNGSGAADISLVFAYMKMLDPTSVVREGEVATANSAGGVPATVLNMYNNLVKGDKLTPDVRGQFVQQADAIYSETAANLGSINDQFTQRANTYQVDPTSFIRQPEQYKPIGTNWSDAGGGFRIREK